MAHRRMRTRYRAYHRRADRPTPPRWDEAEVKRRSHTAWKECYGRLPLSLGWWLRLSLPEPLPARRVTLRAYYAWRRRFKHWWQSVLDAIGRVIAGLSAIVRPFTELLASPSIPMPAAALVVPQVPKTATIARLEGALAKFPQAMIVEKEVHLDCRDSHDGG